MEVYNSHGFSLSLSEQKTIVAKRIIKDPANEGLPIWAYAHHDLGVHYERGWGVEKDLDKARYHFEKAAKAGHLKACIEMANYHAAGRTYIRKSDSKPIDYREANRYVGIGLNSSENSEFDIIYEGGKELLLEELRRLPGEISFLREKRRMENE